MTEVFIAGIGQTPVGELWEISLRDLAVKAIVAAREDAGGLKPEAMYVGNMLAPLLSDQAHLGSLIADHAGMKGIEAADSYSYDWLNADVFKKIFDGSDMVLYKIETKKTIP